MNQRRNTFMSIEIKVPAMERDHHRSHGGALVQEREGETVKRDEPLLELETDKVTVEVPASPTAPSKAISVRGR